MLNYLQFDLNRIILEKTNYIQRNDNQSKIEQKIKNRNHVNNSKRDARVKLIYI